ncbi:Fic/DOC family protein [Paramicrobacterium fandaimingii]|uniref:Fic/DOC family protein n=1 Tax=Paramicrobacterium fandaimingii TaxID=2708079 RepID=UPI00142232F6|nr:Fic family protein [Microbacterium fandaimingii]
MADRYTYPDSDVLVNKYGIANHDDWKEAESDFIGLRLHELHENPIQGVFDLEHLKSIHAHLAQDLYTWGGEIRDTDTHPGGTGIAHCRPPFIVAEAERVFGTLADEEYLRGLDADTFSDRLAWVWGEVTSIHPFRDINTRSQHVFFNQLAREAGWVIDWAQIPGELMAHARTLAIIEDHTGIDALIRPNLLTVAEAQHRDSVAVSAGTHAGRALARMTRRDPEALDRELDAVRERRNGLRPGESSPT